MQRNHIRGVFCQEPESLFALSQCLFRLFTLGDVIEVNRQAVSGGIGMDGKPVVEWRRELFKFDTDFL
jgi:hypothetical protein